MQASVRASAIAGTWYPARPIDLQRSVDSYINAARVPRLRGRLLGVIAPHAGHRYSGSTAGFAFSAIRGMNVDVVAVLSPFHDFQPADFLTTACGAYETPLGIVPVASDLLKNLETDLDARGAQGLVRLSQDSEHAVEIELPFLQRALQPGWRLLPLMVRSQDPSTCRALGEALAAALRGCCALLVASTDLSHYYPDAVAQSLDAQFISVLRKLEPELLFDERKTGAGSACGVGAVAATIWAARAMGGKHLEVLNHSTSGDTGGDRNAVVGYLAAAITGIPA